MKVTLAKDRLGRLWALQTGLPLYCLEYVTKSTIHELENEPSTHQWRTKQIEDYGPFEPLDDPHLEKVG